jgi:hypothetical protein
MMVIVLPLVRVFCISGSKAGGRTVPLVSAKLGLAFPPRNRSGAITSGGIRVQTACDPQLSTVRELRASDLLPWHDGLFTTCVPRDPCLGTRPR